MKTAENYADELMEKEYPHFRDGRKDEAKRIFIMGYLKAIAITMEE